jgi:hypothetical protein
MDPGAYEVQKGHGVDKRVEDAVGRGGWWRPDREERR